MQQAPVLEEPTTNITDYVKYLVLLWHWSWIILVIVIIVTAGTYYVSSIIPPVYQAKTTVLVDMAPSNKSLDYNTLLLSSQLTQTYSQMIIKSPVLKEVATRLALAKVDQKSITAKPVSNTSLIVITAESGDPLLAAEVANMIVSVFTDQVKALQTSRFSASQENLQAQMNDIKDKIKTTTDLLTSTTDLAEKDRLESMIADYSQTYAGLLQSYEQVRLAEAQTLSSIVQIEPAAIPEGPIRPKLLMNSAIACLISLILCAGMIIGTDLLSDKVKTPEDISKRLGLPVLGVISHYKSNGKLIAQSQPLSPITEAYRTLRTNLKYAGAGVDTPLRSVLITSAIASEGKTDVLINLGIVLAQNKQQVLIIDADLRRPTVHSRLGVDNTVGLSQIFLHPELGAGLSLQSTGINGLYVITSGNTPPNPSELLGSQLMGTLLDELKNRFDFILIDTPPSLAVTDAAVMLPFVEGIILVIKPGQTSMAPLSRLVNQFRKQYANILGVVLNDVNLLNSPYGYYYKHYKYYHEYRIKKESKLSKKFYRKQSSLTKKEIAVNSQMK